MKVFPQRFIPFPAVYSYTVGRMKAVDPHEVIPKHTFAPSKVRLLQLIPSSASHHKIVPFNFYCLSMQEKLEQGICQVCHMYWPSKAALARHIICHKQPQLKPASTDELEREPVEEITVTDEDDRKPVFENNFDIFKSPFVDDD